jgi:hypothetical protein
LAEEWLHEVGVAHHRVLDVDDVGAPVGEHRTRGRGEGELRDLHHLWR